jgi:hypothetical protein
VVDAELHPDDLYDLQDEMHHDPKKHGGSEGPDHNSTALSGSETHAAARTLFGFSTNDVLAARTFAEVHESTFRCVLRF